MWTSKVGPDMLCELSFTQTGRVLAHLVLLPAKQWFVTTESNRRLCWCQEKGGVEILCSHNVGLCLHEVFADCGESVTCAGLRHLGLLPRGSCCWVCSLCLALECCCCAVLWQITNPPCGLVSFSVTGNKRTLSKAGFLVHTASANLQWCRMCYFILQHFYAEKKKWLALLCL